MKQNSLPLQAGIYEVDKSIYWNKATFDCHGNKFAIVQIEGHPTINLVIDDYKTKHISNLYGRNWHYRGDRLGDKKAKFNVILEDDLVTVRI